MDTLINSDFTAEGGQAIVDAFNASLGGGGGGKKRKAADAGVGAKATARGAPPHRARSAPTTMDDPTGRRSAPDGPGGIQLKVSRRDLTI